MVNVCSRLVSAECFDTEIGGGALVEMSRDNRHEGRNLDCYWFLGMRDRASLCHRLKWKPHSECNGMLIRKRLQGKALLTS